MLMLIYKLASFDWMGNIFELIPLLSKRSFITISSKRATNMVQHSSYVSQNSKKTQPVNLKQIQTADPDINYLIPTDLSLSTVIVAA